MVFYYRNSILASIISIFGGVSVIISLSEIGTAWPMTIIGLAMCILGKIISNSKADNKAFETWWDTMIGTGKVARMKSDQELCVEVYNENPGKRTLKKIREINPEAGEQIERYISRKKVK